jgi:pimeloyl-ACP methyl ester carboxylesterase
MLMLTERGLVRPLDGSPIRKPRSAESPGYPVIYFSHGLTGTSSEHTAWFCEWASRGFIIVAPCAHTDGSAAVGRTGSDARSDLYYVHPNFASYDPNFRIDQVERRADELEAVRERVLLASTDGAKGGEEGGRLAELAAVMDHSRVLLGGYSYGAATAALVAARAARSDGSLRGLLLVDGWYNIDFSFVKKLSRRLGAPVPQCEDFVAFPPLAHSRGIKIPAIFVGSEAFNDKSARSAPGMRALARRTEELQSLCEASAEVHVIEGTKHWNFQDICLWFPRWLHPLLRRISLLGDCDARIVHRQVSTLLLSFANRVCAQ